MSDSFDSAMLSSRIFVHVNSFSSPYNADTVLDSYVHMCIYKWLCLAVQVDKRYIKQSLWIHTAAYCLKCLRLHYTSAIRLALKFCRHSRSFK